ncbi:MAG: nucleotide exchange factor GrpE [Desulfuromonas sp.]|nr:MAG: nucleotide exchange factor GrpE [Desulfuromonas sp.]
MAKKKKKQESVVEEVEATEEQSAQEAAPEPDEVKEETAEEAPVDYQEEAGKNKDLYLRALADLENYRKRAQRDKEDAIRFANDNLLREMVPVIDNLERAVEHANDDQGSSLLEGVEMTLVQFRKVLETFGVKPVESIGQPFDPNFHQAMGQVESDEYEPNTVVQEMQKGYTLNNRLLRPAMVMVAKTPEKNSADEAESESE